DNSLYLSKSGRIDFTDVPDDDTTLTFLIDLGYKSLLNRHTNMFVDYMHQPWRTLAAIINKCLSGKMATKSISKIEAGEAEAARKVHDTHARIVTESVPESAKKKSIGRSAQSLTPVEQEAADIIQALKESKKSSKRQPSNEGSHEGTGIIPGVPDESTVVSTTSSEGTSAKPGEKDITKENIILKWGNEDDENDDVEKDDKDGDADDQGDDHVSDTQDVDEEDDETKYDEDGIYKYKIRVRKDEDVEMTDAEVKVSNKGEEEVTDAAKEEIKKTSEVKDDTKKIKLPSSSSSLSISLGFGD
nr:hypothetical protein [Tanacetum cinerariifolium]